MSEVARWLHVPRSSVSMWRHETRTIPPKHIEALHERTWRTYEAAVDLTKKAVSLAPTEELREAIRAEFGALYGRWKTEVLHEAGTMRRGLQANVQTLDRALAQQPFRANALAQLDLVWGNHPPASGDPHGAGRRRPELGRGLDRAPHGGPCGGAPDTARRVDAATAWD